MTGKRARGYRIVMPDGTYVQKGDGWNNFVRDPELATVFVDKDAAERGKPGHHRDMGGSGYKGRIVPA